MYLLECCGDWCELQLYLRARRSVHDEQSGDKERRKHVPQSSALHALHVFNGRLRQVFGIKSWYPSDSHGITLIRGGINCMVLPSERWKLRQLL